MHTWIFRIFANAYEMNVQIKESGKSKIFRSSLSLFRSSTLTVRVTVCSFCPFPPLVSHAWRDMPPCTWIFPRQWFSTAISSHLTDIRNGNLCVLRPIQLLDLFGFIERARLIGKAHETPISESMWKTCEPTTVVAEYQMSFLNAFHLNHLQSLHWLRQRVGWRIVIDIAAPMIAVGCEEMWNCSNWYEMRKERPTGLGQQNALKQSSAQ